MWRWVCLLVLTVGLVPCAGRGQRVVIEADLFAGSNLVGHCVSERGWIDACRLVPSTRLGAGLVRVEAVDGSGERRRFTVALRGIESAIEVRSHRDGRLEVARITPAPPTLTVSTLPSGESEAPLLYVFNATHATVQPHPHRGLSLARIQRIQPDGSAVDVRYRPTTCGNWILDADRMRMRVAPGAAFLSHGAPPGGSHDPLEPGASYRVEVCVGVEPGIWWEEGTDPLTLIEASSDVEVGDVLCDTRTYTTEELRAAAAVPVVRDFPGRIPRPEMVTR